MQILSIGDRLKEGRFVLHSKFSEAVNFICHESIISLVCVRIGNGPNNIVVADTNFGAITSIQITESAIAINSKAYERRSLCTYNSEIDIPKSFDFFKNLELIKNVILENAGNKSLAVVLDPLRENDFRSNYEIGLLRLIKNGAQKLAAGEIINGINILKGTGIGLTPAGDDFICGIMYALNLLGKFAGNDNQDLINKIYYSSLGTNLISNTYLYFAKEGRLYEKMKKLLQASTESDSYRLIENTRQVLQSGETSGADMLTGFVFFAELTCKEEMLSAKRKR